MSSFLNECQAGAGWGQCTFEIIDFFPVYTTCFLAGMTYRDISITLLLASLGVSINWGVNLALLYIIQQPAPISSISHGEYASQYGMPAFASQYFVFLFGFFTLFSLLYHQKSLTTFYLAITYIFGVLCLFGRIHYNKNTPNQLLAGSIAGLVVCCLYIFLIDVLILPHQVKLELLFRRFFSITDEYMLTKNVHESLPGIGMLEYRKVDNIIISERAYFNHMAGIILEKAAAL